MRVVTDETCGGCRFIHYPPPVTSMGPQCRRYPGWVGKNLNDWCGEYQPTVFKARLGLGTTLAIVLIALYAAMSSAQEMPEEPTTEEYLTQCYATVAAQEAQIQSLYQTLVYPDRSVTEGIGCEAGTLDEGTGNFAGLGCEVVPLVPVPEPPMGACILIALPWLGWMALRS